MSENTEYTTVSVRVTEEKRKKWEEYIPECDAENLSQLVRMSVKHEIDGTVDAPQTPENVIEPNVMEEVTEGITELQRAMSDVQTRLSGIEEDIEVADAMDIQDAVLRSLPTPPSDIEEDIEVADAMDIQDAALRSLPTPPSDIDDTEPVEYDNWAVTADDIAMNIARSADAVRDVLESLTETAQVRSVAGGPENKKYYWKRE